MNQESSPAKRTEEPVLYSTLFRQEHPEKIGEIEDRVKAFYEKVKIDSDPQQLSAKEVAFVANGVVNRLQRKILEGASEEEIGKAIEDALYEGVGVRLKMRGEGFAEK